MVKLDKIYTRGGDAGYTSIVGGKRIKKSSNIIEGYHHPFFFEFLQKQIATAGRLQKGGGAAVRRPQGVFNNGGA